MGSIVTQEVWGPGPTSYSFAMVPGLAHSGTARGPGVSCICGHQILTSAWWIIDHCIILYLWGFWISERWQRLQVQIPAVKSQLTGKTSAICPWECQWMKNDERLSNIKYMTWYYTLKKKWLKEASTSIYHDLLVTSYAFLRSVLINTVRGKPTKMPNDPMPQSFWRTSFRRICGFESGKCNSGAPRLNWVQPQPIGYVSFDDRLPQADW